MNNPSSRTRRVLECVKCRAQFTSEAELGETDSDSRPLCPECNCATFVTRDAEQASPIADRFPEEVAAGGFTPIPNALQDHGARLGLDALDLAVIAALERHRRGAEAPVWPSRARLARLALCSVSTVKTRLRKLQRLGYVGVEQDHHADTGRWRTNRYRLDGLWRAMVLVMHGASVSPGAPGARGDEDRGPLAPPQRGPLAPTDRGPLAPPKQKYLENQKHNETESVYEYGRVPPEHGRVETLDVHILNDERVGVAAVEVNGNGGYNENGADIEAVVSYLCLVLAQLVAKHGIERPDPTREQGWRSDCRALLVEDGRTADAIEWLVRWVHDADDEMFWLRNIRSMRSLRKHWSRLRLDADRATTFGNIEQSMAEGRERYVAWLGEAA